MLRTELSNIRRLLTYISNHWSSVQRDLNFGNPILIHKLYTCFIRIAITVHSAHYLDGFARRVVRRENVAEIPGRHVNKSTDVALERLFNRFGLFREDQRLHPGKDELRLACYTFIFTNSNFVLSKISGWNRWITRFPCFLFRILTFYQHQSMYNC